MEVTLSPSATGAVLILIAASSLFTMISLSQINYIVNGGLYRYGLDFSYRWAMPYWIFSGIVFGLCWINIAIATIVALYLYKSRRQPKTENMMSAMQSTQMQEQVRLFDYFESNVQNPEVTEPTGNEEVQLSEKADLGLEL